MDSFVRAAAPGFNYGAAGALSVSGPNAVNGSGVANGVFDSLIRFNTAALVTNFNSIFGTDNWAINGAKLRVTELGAPANPLFNRGTGSFEIRWIANDDWVEGTGTPNAPTNNGIAYNTEPALLDGATDASLGTFTNAGVDGTLSFSLALPLRFLNDVRAGGEVGLYLTAIDPATGFTVDSRSFGTTSARPFLEISAIPRPVITAMNFSGPNLVFGASNIAANGTYELLSSTNMALPLNQWLPIATNVFMEKGSFSINLTNLGSGGSASSRFFILQTQ